MKTFVLSRLSDMFIFLSFSIAVLYFCSTDLSVIFLKTPFAALYTLSVAGFNLNLLTVFANLILLSGSVKAAQFFFHT